METTEYAEYTEMQGLPPPLHPAKAQGALPQFLGNWAPAAQDYQGGAAHQLRVRSQGSLLVASRFAP